MSDDRTPRERSAEEAGFPTDITFGELREELTRAWAIVDRQTIELDRLRTLYFDGNPLVSRAVLRREDNPGVTFTATELGTGTYRIAVTQES